MSFTLIISEKPQASQKIASALATSPIRKKAKAGAYWLEFERKGEQIICVPAVGHLFVLDTESSSGWTYPVFDAKWLPSYTRKGSEFSRKYFKNIQALADGAKKFVVACDYDVEGEVIGYNILRFICKQDDAKRMKFSTLTKPDLIEAYENMMPHIDFGQVEAGLTRHYMDFFWGINTTRALTLALKDFINGFKVVSTGRVQGPTLAILSRREKEIKSFVPTPYWQIELHARKNGQVIVTLYEKDKIWEKDEAQKIYDECKGKDPIVKDIETRKYKQNPPVPFDTTVLQTEAYRCFGISPSQTLSVAESLYTAGYISYPRTSSQKLPEKIGYKKIIESLKKLFGKECSMLLAKKQLKPMEGKKADPAHPAIFPTTQAPDLSKLNANQRKIYELVARRFLATFGDPAIRQSMKVTLVIDAHNFIANGVRTLEPGWITLYGKFATLKEELLPELKKGELLKQEKLNLMEKQTQPPARYTQASILKEMEKRGLGTKATRSTILQTLYDRGYVLGKSIEVTEFGMQVIEVLEKHCPKVISEELTRKFEDEMEFVRLGEKKREKILEEAKVVLSEILTQFKKEQNYIGKELSQSYIRYKRGQKIVGKCLKCGKDLLIIRAKKSGKRFVGCSGYKDGCDFSAPLPQKGVIKTTDSVCKSCSYPVITLKIGKNKPFVTCINMKCESKNIKR